MRGLANRNGHHLEMFGKVPQPTIDYYKEAIVNTTNVSDSYKEIIAVTGDRMGNPGRQAFYQVFSDHHVVQN